MGKDNCCGEFKAEPQCSNCGGKLAINQTAVRGEVVCVNCAPKPCVSCGKPIYKPHTDTICAACFKEHLQGLKHQKTHIEVIR